MARLEVDHEEPFAEVKCTATKNLGPKCHFHHRLKTLHGWEMDKRHRQAADGPTRRPPAPQAKNAGRGSIPGRDVGHRSLNA
jgi:hypothetical protein